MSNLTYKPVKIEIVYSNSETRKLGIKEGDVFDALHEHYKGQPKMAFQFEKDGNHCIAYAAEHDDDPMVMVTTCKIYEENQLVKQIKSDLNRVKAQIKQLNESELFSQEDRDRLNPIYNSQLDELKRKIAPAGAEIEVKDAEIVSNQSEE